ncbi:hypothetical protein EVAR_8341_1 [Eumeta japonica]|uniref:Uncharacterized protein n=1 Tax=Eumeta variegata TaxID=151549 RepID=A0A4C1VBJ1_EUMVA|nr:hypothetical protein EVAR_8341_1 [Eumeta japonica]
MILDRVGPQALHFGPMRVELLVVGLLATFVAKMTTKSKTDGLIYSPRQRERRGVTTWDGLPPGAPDDLGNEGRSHRWLRKWSRIARHGSAEAIIVFLSNRPVDNAALDGREPAAPAKGGIDCCARAQLS